MTPTQRLPPVRRFITVRLIPLVVILASGFFIVVGVQATRLARESVGWPSVDGEIVRSHVVKELDTSSGPRSATYRPSISYRYRVGDTEFTGERVALGEYATADQADADAVVQRYPAGRRLPVHYRPEAPGTAVLEVGARGAAWLYAALGSVFLIAGLVLAWVAPKLIAPAAAS